MGRLGRGFVMRDSFRKMAGVLGWILAIVALGGVTPLAVAEGPAGSGRPVARAPLAIIYSNDTMGYLEPCG